MYFDLVTEQVWEIAQRIIFNLFKQVQNVITLEQAHRIARESSRYEHALIVGSIMRVLAKRFAQDHLLWMLVGILHDIDWDETQDTKERHGITAAEALKGKLPEEALHAIMSHDYRTGIEPVTPLDNALIFADALAHIFSNMEKTPEFSYHKYKSALGKVTESGRPWMQEIIQNYIIENDLSSGLIEELWRSSQDMKGY